MITKCFYDDVDLKIIWHSSSECETPLDVKLKIKYNFPS